MSASNAEKLAQLQKLGHTFCLDTETAMAPLCFKPRQWRLLQLHNDNTSVWFDIPMLAPDDMRQLRSFLMDPAHSIYAQNVAFDYRVLMANGITLRGELYDTMIASALIHNGEAKVSNALDAIARRELGVVLDKTLQKQDWMNAELNEADMHYAMEDVRVTWEAAHVLHEKVHAQGLYDVYRLECALVPAVVQMEHHGIYLDPSAIADTVDFYSGESVAAKECFLETLDSRLEEEGAPRLPREEDGSFNTRVKDSGSIRLGTKRFAGFNINSSQQVLAWWKYLGIEPVDDAKKPSLDKKVLARFQSDELVRLFLQYKRVEKRLGMAQKLVEHCDDDGRIRARFMPLATGTGRFSCVAGDTVLITSRGDFTFEEYAPVEGDLVLTHNGRWMPVVRKLYRGVEDTVELVTTEGAKLTCTRDHRLLSQGCWVAVESLRPGDTLEYFAQLDQRRGQHQCGVDSLQGRRQAHYESDSSRAGGYSYKRSACATDALASRGTACRAGAAVLTRKGGEAQPDGRQEWFPSPQLQGLSSRSQGVSDRTRRFWGSGVPAPTGDGASHWSGDLAFPFGGASHRRQPAQQQLGQPGSGDLQRAQRLTSSETRVVSVKPVGPMGVWDIEVLGDHSYALYGFLSHNCSSPNLQQIPRDAEFRGAFKAPEGRVLVQADYSAMELRVAAAIAGEQRMIDAFNAGADIHTRSAALMFGIEEAEVTKPQRQQAKALNFGALYGSGAKGVQAYCATLGLFISFNEAVALLARWHEAYPAFGKWHQKCDDRAQAGEPVRTVTGRRRRLFGDDNRLTTQANNVVQGTSADIMKAALVEIHRQLPLSAFLVATVHDEVLVECDEDDGDAVLATVLREMEAAAVPVLGTGIRISAEGGVLTSWGDK